MWSTEKSSDEDIHGHEGQKTDIEIVCECSILLQVLYLAGSNVDSDREEYCLVPGFFSIVPCHTRIAIWVGSHSALNYKIIQSQTESGFQIASE